jgi:C-terminal processing protease CtpA/Prc
LNALFVEILRISRAWGLLRTSCSALGVMLLAGTFGFCRSQQEFTAHDREFAEGILSQVYETLKHNYYDPTFHGIDIDQRLKTYADQIKTAKTMGAAYRVIEAYLAGLGDSHTVFIPPPNSKLVTYGFRLKMIGDRCFITDVRPSTDAAQKLHPGDQVISLDGYTLNRKDLWQLEYYLYRLPPRLTTDFALRGVTGEVRHESVTADFQEARLRTGFSVGDVRLRAEKLQHISRSRSVEVGNVLLWKFPAFNGDEDTIFRLVGQARKHESLILDLRENLGGFESTLQFMLGHLFDHDVTIGRQIMRKEQKSLVAKSRGHEAFNGKLIVLIDSRTSSAAEIFARVVQIQSRGTVIGDRSGGSVMTAQFFPLKEGVGFVIPFGVEITVGSLLMADGKSLENTGVTPDVIVLPSEADLASGRDPVLAYAIEMAGGKLDATAAGKLFQYEWPPVDINKN